MYNKVLSLESLSAYESSYFQISAEFLVFSTQTVFDTKVNPFDNQSKSYIKTN